MNKHNEIAYSIYEFLNNNISNFPPFAFQLGNDLNDSIIFTISRNKYNEYFNCNVKIYSFDIRCYLNKYDHFQQLNICDKIKQLLVSNEFKNKIYNKYITTLIYINDLPNPNFDDFTFELESYNDVAQCYQINLTLYLKEQK